MLKSLFVLVRGKQHIDPQMAAGQLTYCSAALVRPCLKLWSCLQGLEVYSTVLWHMKKEVELSYLAQEAIAPDRRSPYAWAIMGNCFSLQKVRSALSKWCFVDYCDVQNKQAWPDRS